MPQTCTSCNVQIEVNFKDHFKTDWHLYNLKRKIAALPAVTEGDFNEKLRLVSLHSANQQQESSETFYCEICHKRFTENGPYQQHLQSKQHLKSQTSSNSNIPSRSSSIAETLTAAGEGDVGASSSSKQDEKEEHISLNECLFCGCMCNTVDNLVRHMENKHCFIIPDKDALKDLEGLLQCMADIIAVEHRCLWCLQPFSSMRSTRQHMLDKSHTRLQNEGDAWLIYADYYDYEATGEYESASEDESDEEAESDTDDGTQMVYERVLPSGAVIGCRALRLYYRQYLPTNSQRNTNLRALPNTTAKLLQLASRSNNGNMQISSSSYAQTKKWNRADLSYLQRCKQKKHMQLGVRHNKLQKHFRVEENY
jgi:pre-60S factor REI1